jgi:hypothetical protein
VYSAWEYPKACGCFAAANLRCPIEDGNPRTRFLRKSFLTGKIKFGKSVKARRIAKY